MSSIDFSILEPKSFILHQLMTYIYNIWDKSKTDDLGFMFYICMQQKSLLTILWILILVENSMFCSILDLLSNSYSIMRSKRPLKLLKDQKHNAHLCYDRSELCLKYLVLITIIIISVDNTFISTTLTTLIIIHIIAIFIFSHLSDVKLILYAGLPCKTISESFLNLLRISY